MQEWQNKFSVWSSGPGDTETEKIDNAVRQVRNAINKSAVLKDKELKIIVQGSYRNNVNVKKDSDVDLGILLTEVFKVDSHSKEIIREVRKNYEDSTYEYSTYKNDVQQALIDHFGKPAVTRGNKAISIKENTNRIEADVVPLFEYRLYSTLISYDSGVQLYTDDNNKNIINWPEQNYDNGVKKNNESNRRFKRIVRIMKKLKNEMEESNPAKYNYLNNVPGFLIENMIYHVPNNMLTKDSYYDSVKASIVFLYNEIDKGTDYLTWKEINGKKDLFNQHQKWNANDAKKFLFDAWNYIR